MRVVTRTMLWALLAGICVIQQPVAVGQQKISGLQVNQNSIGGIVVNINGGKPEAGVWVIAETKSLPVPFRKIVVTDDQGRFVVPDLPDGSYEVWVRGYGLRDSDRVKAARGGQIRIQVSNAANPQEAAKIYPACYWTSLIKPPEKSELPPQYASQDEWLATWRNGCNHCHELGMVATRRYTTPEEWDSVFQRARNMNAEVERLGRIPLEKSLADWGVRIKAGEVPPAPPRPIGMERNVVISQWDWGASDSFIHDVTSTDKRNPTLYPNGKVYGADRTGGGRLWVLDPVKNTVQGLQIQPRNAKGLNTKNDYYHDPILEADWMASPHNPMLDENGRVWLTEPVRPPGAANFPKWGTSTIATETNNPEELAVASKLLLAHPNDMQLGYYDTKANKFVGVDTSYGTHHLQFDWQGRIWTDDPGGAVALGELDTTKLDLNNPEATEAAAQKAWMRVDMDTKKTVPEQSYATAVSPVDGTVWQSDPQAGGAVNKLYSFDPKTHKFKDYPLPPPGRLAHGIDFSTDGNVWISTGSGHLGRLDPKTRKFTLWELPGLKFQGTGSETGSTEFPYFLWVDQFDAFGLGKNTVIVTGTTSDSLIVFDPKKETFSVLRIPYPLPFYSRGMDGRIDDPKTGWKGRGIWATYSSYFPKFTETRMGSVEHVQMRPSPLAN